MNRLSRTLSGVVVLLAAASAVVPFIAICVYALQPSGSLAAGFTLPDRPHFENFADAWSVAEFANLYRASGVIALVVVPVAVLFSTLAGYALGTIQFRGSGAVLAFFLLGLTLPYESVVIPLYYGLRGVGLLDTYWALILPLSGLFMPFGVFWMRSHFQSLPPELVEAAELDGANSFQVFTRILLPTARPALATLGLLYFMWSWNQFLLALILIQNTSLRTAPAGLGQFVTQYGKNIPLLSASTIIVIVPVVIVYLIFQRQLVRGILQGAVK